MYGGTDFYTILGIDHYATRGEIKQAYRRLAKQHHPDLNPNDPTAEEQFQQINEAYETLYDSGKRVRYDSGFEDSFKAAYATSSAQASYTQHTYVHNSYTQSGYGHTDFGNNQQNFEDSSFDRQLFSSFDFKNLPTLHYVVLAALGTLLLIIPFDSSVSFSEFTGISMRLTFFVVHLVISSRWVDRSCHNLKDDFMLLPMMLMFTHGASAILSLITTFLLQGALALIFHLPRYLADAWSQV